MINKIIRSLSDLIRRFENGVKIGTICEVDHKTGRAKVQIGKIKTNWLPWCVNRAHENGEWHALEVGEQVVVISPSGKTEQAIIIAAINYSQYPMQDDDPELHSQWYKDGAKISYNRQTHHYKIDLPIGATTTINTSGGLDIDAKQGVNIKGDVTVKGDVIADGISLKNHVHTGVKSGTSNTGVPI